ncbi:hypothetical protein MKW94_001262 [Papaver nudicaule]|uniref:Uncharacterized protein n=1 Tax=Papaver nudicaule TaxID=74823 RepID=A0AA41VCF3_PAPNU|nr:hypothetical protein [Papaver nudicaule]
MASKNHHIFKKSAIEAGTPELYYLNPSENLMKMASEWSVVDQEDRLALTVHLFGFGDDNRIRVDGKFIKLEVVTENKEKAARFADDKNDMKNFSFEMNTNYLDHLHVTDDRSLKVSEGTIRLYLSKLKAKK